MTILMPPCSYVYRCCSKNKQSVLGAGKESTATPSHRDASLNKPSRCSSSLTISPLVLQGLQEA
uniref:Uncharacterized protein n=1 Tax=Pavo cristatus TaxID=9049 RepID=A0A8C9FU12_PAVCR